MNVPDGALQKVLSLLPALRKPTVSDLADESGRKDAEQPSDDHGEVRRYVWDNGKPIREVIYTHPGGLDGFTWNIMPAPLELLP